MGHLWGNFLNPLPLSWSPVLYPFSALSTHFLYSTFHSLFEYLFKVCSPHWRENCIRYIDVVCLVTIHLTSTNSIVCFHRWSAVMQVKQLILVAWMIGKLLWTKKRGKPCVPWVSVKIWQQLGICAPLDLPSNSIYYNSSPWERRCKMIKWKDVFIAFFWLEM